jgi:vancomycin permeability regulator SanA
MRILIILLGCHIARLLNGRIEAAVELASSYHQQVDWLLSGGIKHNNGIGASITEAQQMAEQISKKEPAYGTPVWNYILDTKATNTAENFLRLRDMDLTVYDEVYIATSEFHYERAAKIASLIIDDRIKKINWILAEQKEPDSEYWERIHIRNVEADVGRALQQRM